MRSFFRRSTGRSLLEPDELTGLDAAVGKAVDPLAVARGDGALVVATRGCMAVSREGRWQVVPWDEILNGGWDAPTTTLRWSLLDGTRESVQLGDPAELPGVFIERIQASIVVQKRFEIPGELGTIVISGRRNPARADDLRWMVQPIGRTDLADPEVRRVATAETENLKREYE